MSGVKDEDRPGVPGGQSGAVLADRGPVSFDWRKRRWGPLALLAFFVVVSVLVHSGFFYLFRVFHPVGERPVEPTGNLVVLRPGDESARPFLQALEDREVSYRGTVDPPVDGMPGLDGLSAYVPSYAGFEPSLAPWPKPAEAELSRLPPLARPGALDLPASRESRARVAGAGSGVPGGTGPRPGVPGAGAPAATVQVGVQPSALVVTAGGGLAGRGLVRVPGPGDAIWREVTIAPGGRAEFVVGVDRSGRIAYRASRAPAVQGVGGGAGAVDALVDGIRFERAPITSPRVVWGTLFLEW